MICTRTGFEVVSEGVADDAPAGTVIDQSPAPDTLVEPGSTINIMLDVGNYAGAVCPAGWCSFDGLRITNLSHAGSFGGYNVAMTLGTDLAAFQKDGNGNLWLNFAGSDLYANNE